MDPASSFRQFIVDTSAKILPDKAANFIQKQLGKTMPTENADEFTSYIIVGGMAVRAEESRGSRLERHMDFVDISQECRQSIRDAAAEAFTGVRDKYRKSKMKSVDAGRAAFSSQQTKSLGSVVDNSHFKVNVHSQGHAEALLRQKGTRNGDFILYRPDANDSKIALAYVKEGAMQHTNIDIDDKGKFVSIEADGIKNYGNLTRLIQSKVPSYQPLTAKGLAKLVIKTMKDEFAKEDMKTEVRESAKYSYQQRIKMCYVIEHSKFSVDAKDFSDAKKLLEKRGVKDGDFVLYRPNNEETQRSDNIACQAKLVYVYGDQIKEAQIDISEDGKYTVIDEEGFAQTKDTLDSAIHSKVDSYTSFTTRISSFAEKTGSKISDVALRAAHDIAFSTKEAHMSTAARATRALLEPQERVALSSNAGDCAMLQSGDDPSIVDCKMRGIGNQIHEFPIKINTDGTCDMLFLIENGNTSMKKGQSINEILYNINQFRQYFRDVDAGTRQPPPPPA